MWRAAAASGHCGLWYDPGPCYCTCSIVISSPLPDRVLMAGMAEHLLDDEGSKANEGEADVVQRLVAALVAGGVPATAIGIITPYNLQVSLCQLSITCLSAVSAGPLHIITRPITTTLTYNVIKSNLPCLPLARPAAKSCLSVLAYPGPVCGCGCASLCVTARSSCCAAVWPRPTRALRSVLSTAFRHDLLFPTEL